MLLELGYIPSCDMDIFMCVGLRAGVGICGGWAMVHMGGFVGSRARAGV